MFLTPARTITIIDLIDKIVIFCNDVNKQARPSNYWQ